MGVDMTQNNFSMMHSLYRIIISFRFVKSIHHYLIAFTGLMIISCFWLEFLKIYIVAMIPPLIVFMRRMIG